MPSYTSSHWINYFQKMGKIHSLLLLVAVLLLVLLPYTTPFDVTVLDGGQTEFIPQEKHKPLFTYNFADFVTHFCGFDFKVLVYTPRTKE